MANETPIFMAHCLQAARQDRTIAFAIIECGKSLGMPIVTKKDFNYISETPVAVLVCDRPKTPCKEELLCRKPASVWLARYFNPVWLAICDNKTDAECLAIWRNCEKSDQTKAIGWRKIKTKKQARRGRIYINFRDRDPSAKWNIVK